MNIKELANEGLKVMVTLSLNDLKELYKEVARASERKANEQAALSKRHTPTTLTRVEVMKCLHVSPSTLWRWEKDGYLIPQRVGRKVYYRRADIERLSV